MMRSMYAGVSGLRNHQIRMDVIGNNIANVNTVGFKTSRVTFRELFSQTMRSASALGDGRGGTNPMQVGLGMTLGSIDEIHERGNVQYTGINTDMAIQGDGFFILKDGNNTLYSRVGTFDIDSNGNLVDKANGLRVQGWQANADGTFGTRDSTTLTDIRIPLGSQISPMATENLELVVNLDSRLDIGDTFVVEAAAYDSLGNLHTILITFEKTAVNQWDWTAQWLDPDGNLQDVTPASPQITFQTNGQIDTGASATIQFTLPGAAQVSVDLDMSGITQFAAKSDVGHIFWDGYATGSLERFTVDQSGVITGVFSNGITMNLAQVALASFANPAGLLNEGENLYTVTNNSGAPHVGEPGTGHRGRLAPGSLEMSNVDLAQEFTDMIVTQRGFQANSRIITTSDEMLHELVNLKR